jgi:hypothetical protein
MGKLQAAGDVFIARVGGQWVVQRDQLIEDDVGE